MKRAILAGVSAAAILMSLTAANAADLPRRHVEMPVKAPAYVPPFSWTGFYVGINGGGAFGRSDWSGIAAFDTRGAVVGGTAGYNWQMPNNFVVGVEGDVDWSNNRGSTACGVGLTCETRNDWLGTFRGRAGYAFGRVLPYVTGGLAVGNIKANVPTVGSTDTTNAGWTVGAGVEAAITGPLSAKIEYLYADLGKGNCDAAVCGGGANTDVNFHTNVVRAGLNYHF
jgi:outer membrane immunogenic protein